ncbi:MAG: nucleotide sugar dehydrogenase [Verrucomicrobia bacterium]|nr:nucleotide sugar dehydrogenase [Verrucomicrobiota bacterium]
MAGDSRLVCILGLWHQGIVGAACLADLGYTVIGADRDTDTIERLRSGHAPIFEPGLDTLIQSGLSSGKLSFSSDLAEAVRQATDLLLMWDTPVDDQDQSDLSGIFAVVNEIAPHVRDDAVMLVTAQVPVGTCDQLQTLLKKKGVTCGIAYMPENLRLGQAIERFRSPPLPVIGANDPETLARIDDLLAVLEVPLHHVSLRTAEMIKHALNAYLATSITFGNELGALCDEVGADGQQVAEMLRLEPRIGAKAMLFPGLGFSGGTLARDLQTLRGLGDRQDLETRLLDGVWAANQAQNGIVLRKLKQRFGSLSNLRIGVLGLTYKPGTSTLRRSAALEIIADLIAEGAVVTAQDPKADRDELHRLHAVTVVDDPYVAAKDAAATLVITGWPEYKQLDFERLKAAMTGNLLMDCNNMLDGESLLAMGFDYRDIGRGR